MKQLSLHTKDTIQKHLENKYFRLACVKHFSFLPYKYMLANKCYKRKWFEIPRIVIKEKPWRGNFLIWAAQHSLQKNERLKISAHHSWFRPAVPVQSLGRNACWELRIQAQCKRDWRRQAPNTSIPLCVKVLGQRMPTWKITQLSFTEPDSLSSDNQ